MEPKKPPNQLVSGGTAPKFRTQGTVSRLSVYISRKSLACLHFLAAYRRI